MQSDEKHSAGCVSIKTQIIESKIASLLKTLEKDTNMVVESIGLEGVDISMINDNKTELRRHVVVNLHSVPHSKWYKGCQGGDGYDSIF